MVDKEELELMSLEELSDLYWTVRELYYERYKKIDKLLKEEQKRRRMG